MVHGEAVDSTSFKVTWDAPPKREQNGQILGYRVQYSEAKGSLTGPDPSVDMATLPSSDTSYVVRGLRKWTLYSVQVLAYTAKGDGPLSDVIMVQTAEDGNRFFQKFHTVFKSLQNLFVFYSHSI